MDVVAGVNQVELRRFCFLLRSASSFLLRLLRASHLEQPEIHNRSYDNNWADPPPPPLQDKQGSGWSRLSPATDPPSGPVFVTS